MNGFLGSLDSINGMDATFIPYVVGAVLLIVFGSLLIKTFIKTFKGKKNEIQD